MKSCVGVLPIREKQANQLGLMPRTQLSPLLEKCCLLVSANESYQNAESDIEALTGVKVGHSTQHRLVQPPCSSRCQTQSKPFVKSASMAVKYDCGVNPGKRVKERDYKGVREHRYLLWCLLTIQPLINGLGQ